MTEKKAYLVTGHSTLKFVVLAEDEMQAGDLAAAQCEDNIAPQLTLSELYDWSIEEVDLKEALKREGIDRDEVLEA